ncbi:MAG: hypothetical protein C7B45_01835 [Sulfobacillus acidophilus]|uniref:Glycoside hydrolase family 5 domain-containing protein n=1 Tax=Sulfobacillus acidophilus TaxID=53633 RepID=A0A2T2WNH0_9FIRM|nr:MAG: hypothetical protein C7B45_01835 [Sulfobacillus acidophilus]
MRVGVRIAEILGVLAIAAGCGSESVAPDPLPPLSACMQGMTEAGYTTEVFNSPAVRTAIIQLHQDGVNWLSIQVAWYQKSTTSTHIAPNQKTPSDASVTRLIKLAHREGMRVLLDPFVNSMRGSGWQALFHPRSVRAWFASFDHYIAHYAQLSQADQVDLLAIGDEFDTLDHVPSYESYWAHAIAVARHYYKGPLTYGADYPDYQQVSFWPLLNDVGLDAYFPLSDLANPTTALLRSRWNVLADQIERWRVSTGLASKPFLVTELGYPSEDGADATPGTWYPNEPVNLALQRKLYLATFQSLWQRTWVRGIMWFWWANPSNPHWLGGRHDNGYTPRGKPALTVIKQYFLHKSGHEIQKHNVSRN